jgi:hypothetical protein
VYGWYELLVEGKGDLEVEDLNSNKIVIGILMGWRIEFWSSPQRQMNGYGVDEWRE